MVTNMIIRNFALGKTVRPTTKDLAKHLGMSRSTVDRVLNRRPGVKEKTVKAVQKAIEEIGFKRNISAANLARKRIYRFEFILPSGEGEFLKEISRQVNILKNALQPDGIEVGISQYFGNDQHKIARYLSNIDSKKYDGIAILANESPEVRDALRRVKERGVHVVRIISGGVEEVKNDFVGIDNYAAGMTAARLLGSFTPNKAGNILVVSDTMISPDTALRRAGFDRTLQVKFPSLTALPTLETYGSSERAEIVIATAFESYCEILGIYLMSSECKPVLDAIIRLKLKNDTTIIAHEHTEASNAYLKSGLVDALIVQDTGHVVRSALRKLRAKCDERKLVATQEKIRIEVLLLENLM